jgi:putative transposase
VPTHYDPQKHHRRSTRLKGYDYTQPGAYFVTICTWHYECIFGEVRDGEMHLNPFGRAALQVWQDLPRHYPYVILGEFCIMPNHVHAIIIFNDDHPHAPPSNPPSKGGSISVTTQPAIQNNKHHRTAQDLDKTRPYQSHGLPEIVRAFKSFSARRINFLQKTSGTPVWQRNYYEHIIRSENDLQKVNQYIRANPANWEKDEENPNITPRR